MALRIAAIKHNCLKKKKKRIREWVAIPFSRGFSRPKDQTRVSGIAGEFVTIWVSGKAR